MLKSKTNHNFAPLLHLGYPRTRACEVYCTLVRHIFRRCLFTDSSFYCFQPPVLPPSPPSPPMTTTCMIVTSDSGKTDAQGGYNHKRGEGGMLALCHSHLFLSCKVNIT